ncbi:MAG: hypothetical protein ACK4R2_00295 [Roseateles sp.]
MDRVQWHAMIPADLDAVLALQQRCYGVGFFERREAFAAELAASDGLGCCWLARRDGSRALRLLRMGGVAVQA